MLSLGRLSRGQGAASTKLDYSDGEMRESAEDCAALQIVSAFQARGWIEVIVRAVPQEQEQVEATRIAVGRIHSRRDAQRCSRGDMSLNCPMHAEIFLPGM